MQPPPPIIYIVDDDLKALKSAKECLAATNWSVVCLPSSSDFLSVYHPPRAGCLVLELEMPDITGLELQQSLTDRKMDIPIVFITDTTSVTKSIRALKAGAADLIEKPLTAGTLIAPINNALQTQAALRKKNQVLEAANLRFKALSVREWEVMNAMLSGPNVLSSKEVARELGISHRTVEHHRSRIMEKTSSRSLPELIRLASFIGINHPDLPDKN